MSVSSFRRALIEEMIANNGNAQCHYCKIICRLSFSNEFKNSATIDHKIPRSKGGTNARENLVIACNGCNNLKGSRSYESFKANPHGTGQKPFRAAKIKVNIGGGTMADAIARGEMTYFGEYKKPKCEINPEPRNRISALPYADTMWILTGRRAPRKADLLDKL